MDEKILTKKQVLVIEDTLLLVALFLMLFNLKVISFAFLFSYGCFILIKWLFYESE